MGVAMLMKTRSLVVATEFRERRDETGTEEILLLYSAAVA